MAIGDFDRDGRIDLAFAPGVAVELGTGPLPVPDTPPHAVISTTPAVECTGPSGGAVTLDGSKSTDVDSTPGTHDDIVSYEWLEDPGRPGERALGTGAVLSLTLPIGAHSIGLRVTDSHRKSDPATTLVTVRDTVPPVLTLAADPSVLCPPNHRLVAVQVTPLVSDICDPAPTARLTSVASSEPVDAPGNADGATTEDVGSAEIGTLDTQVLLRAERSGGGPGRTYEITYTARDAAGNESSALALVTVPHDLGQGPEPLQIRAEPGGTRGTARLYWSAVAGAQRYDLISGDVASLKVEGDHISLGAVRVPARLLTATAWTEGDDSSTGAATVALPAAGQAFFYL